MFIDVATSFLLFLHIAFCTTMTSSMTDSPLNERRKPIASQKYNIDPSSGRKVPYKKINNAYLVHQRWLEKQRRKAECTPHMLDENEETSPMANTICTVIMTLFFSLVIGVFAGLFVHGDPLWGYRGKWSNWRTYIPVCRVTLTKLTSGKATRIYAA